jgi:uncharacterized protein
MQDEDFEWDDAKASTNLRRHKISFREARRVFDDMFVVIDQDTSGDYGEDRFLATGIVEGLLIVVVYTERGERIRIISARKANSHEQREYYRSQTPS